MSVRDEMQQIAEQEGFSSIDEWLVAAYNKHRSTKKMEKIYGFAYSTFCNYLHKLGVKLQRGGARPHKKIDIDKDELVKLLSEKVPITRIAEKFGVDRKTIYRRLDEWRMR